MRLIVTRPEADAKALAEALTRQGHEAVLAPLLDIVFDASAAIPGLDYQAVLVTSASGARALAERPETAWLGAIPIVAVGPASMEAARHAGFRSVLSADGDVAALVDWVRGNLDPAAGPLLYASGDKTSGDLQGELATLGYSVERAILYEARAAATMPQPAAEALRSGRADGVLLFSPRTARTWVGLATKAALSDRIGGLTHYCLSRNVARVIVDALGANCPIYVAPRPDEAAMLKLIGEARTGLVDPLALP